MMLCVCYIIEGAIGDAKVTIIFHWCLIVTLYLFDLSDIDIP